jgi:hypothetical protein
VGLIDNAFVSTILLIAKMILNFISSSSLLMILFSGSLVGVGCYALKKIKSVSRK